MEQTTVFFITLDKAADAVYFNLRIFRKLEAEAVSKYLTRQRRLLLDYLTEHADETLSAGQIAEDLSGAEISVSAVYRNLAALEQEGRLHRAAGSGKEQSYRYSDAEGCRGCLHLSCTCCGRTFHMDRTDAERLVDAVAEAEGFAVDRAETVLYGLCAACREARA